MPRLQALEDRSVPAGVVNATFAGGVLTITAVDDLTDVNITNANHQSITLDGAGASNITVIANTAETGTAITGSPFNGVTSIKLNMGLGSDLVVITDTVLGGAVTFLGGSGNNALFIDGAGNFSGLAGGSPGNVTLGSVSVTNGDGFDNFIVGGGNHSINGSVTINNSVGGSDTRFGVLAANQTTIGGAVKVTNLDGVDNFSANGTAAAFAGAVTISNGNGGSTTSFNATTNTLTGGIAVTSGEGDDDFITGGTSFTVGTPTVRRNITISNGNGVGSTDQIFSATTNTINGNITVTALAGDDDFTVNGTNFNVLGNVKINTGNGGGTTSISPIQVVDIGGFVAVTAGEGIDQLDFDGATSVDVGSVSFSSGNGQSVLDFNGGVTTIAGSVRYTHLAGNSTTTFDSTTHNITGAITSTHGDGNNIFDVNGTNFTSGAITIRNGAGVTTTNLDAGTSNTINGNVSVTNDEGTDIFTAGGGTFVLGSAAARRNLTISNGNGTSSTTLGAPIGNSTIHGNISLTNRDGLDTVNVNGTFNVTGAGNLSIKHGNGGSNTNVIPSTAVNIGGKLSVSAADGIDTVVLQRLTVSGSTSINTGNANDTILIHNSTFDGLFSASTGAGTDLVRIEVGFLDDLVDTEFNAAVNINTGNGDDEVTIGAIGDADDIVDFNAAVTITGGLDLDIIQALANPVNTFAVPPTITGFEQGT